MRLIAVNEHKLDAFLDKTYGFTEELWLATREHLTRRLEEIARAQQRAFYGDLCDELRRNGFLDLEPHGTPFAAMLGQVNLLEHDGGRPLLSAIVISKDSNAPGVGFWNFARELAIDVGDSEEKRLEFWLESLRACHGYWATH